MKKKVLAGLICLAWDLQQLHKNSIDSGQI